MDQWLRDDPLGRTLLVVAEGVASTWAVKALEVSSFFRYAIGPALAILAVASLRVRNGFLIASLIAVGAVAPSAYTALTGAAAPKEPQAALPPAVATADSPRPATAPRPESPAETSSAVYLSDSRPAVGTILWRTQSLRSPDFDYAYWASDELKRPLVIDGVTYTKGVQVFVYHGRSGMLEWPVPAGYSGLTALIGLDDHYQHDLPTVVTFHTPEGQVLHRVTINPIEASKRVSVKLDGVSVLRISFKPENAPSCRRCSAYINLANLAFVK